ncbi:MAG: hypothetical protein QM648_02110 [Solirubrobacterales bacterium]
MYGSPQPRRKFGPLETLVITLLEVSFLTAGISAALGFLLMLPSKVWTTREKLIASGILFSAYLLVVAFASLFGMAMQDWIRIPMMFTVAGLTPAIAGIYLYFRVRSDRDAPASI